MSRFSKKIGFVFLFTLILSVQSRAEMGKAGSSTSEATTPQAKTGLVFSLRPEMGFVNPVALNESTTSMNTAVSGLYKVNGADAPMVSNTIQANMYLGYAFSDSLDVGAFFSIPPMTTKKISGQSAAGTAATRTVGLSASMLGLQANYAFVKTDNFRVYASPAIGWGSFSVIDKLESGAAGYDIVMESKNIAMKGSLGVAYQLSPLFSLQGEAGYMQWNSGSLTHKNAFAAKGINAGDTAKNATGDGDLKTDLSGPFIGVGVTFTYPI